MISNMQETASKPPKTVKKSLNLKLDIKQPLLHPVVFANFLASYAHDLSKQIITVMDNYRNAAKNELNNPELEKKYTELLLPMIIKELFEEEDVKRDVDEIYL